MRPDTGPVRWAERISVTLVAAAAVAGLLVPGPAAAAAPVLLITGFLVGLPHGAVDHLVPAWTGLSRGGAGPMLAVLGGYVTVAALAWLALTFAGPIAVLAVLAVSVVHFGLGDLMADHTAGPDVGRARTGSRWWLADVAAVLARGGPVVVLTLALWPQVTDPVLGAFDPAVPVLLTPALRTGLVLALAVCATVAVGDAVRRGRPREAVEVVLLSMVFVVLPPFAAFGIYFGGWHALRHTARLLAADPRNTADLATGAWRAPVRRFARSAALPTGVVLTAVAALVLLAREPVLFVPVLSVLLALTVPHVMVVGALDHATRTTTARSPRSGRHRHVDLNQLRRSGVLP